jgi:hypothetical protein
MQDFIQEAAHTLDADESTIESVTRALLGLLKDKGDSEAVEELLTHLPGAPELADGSATGGGVLGGIGAMLGGSAGALMTLAGSGLSRDQISQLAEMFHDYAQERVSPELVDKVLASVPELVQMKG